jgi:PIN domain nuclease of toxin-antitoxin system
VAEWWQTAIAQHGIVCIPVSAEIALASVALPPHHNDPADRIIIATAMHHAGTVLTPDAAFRDYVPANVAW